LVGAVPERVDEQEDDQAVEQLADDLAPDVVDEIVDLMVKHPDLIQRPIVEKGARAILARPAERLKEIL